MWDKRDKNARRRDEIREKQGKTEYEKIISGEAEPVGSQKGWMNLKTKPVTERTPEERREICKKGAAAVNRIRGQEKTAKESIDRMLSILATDEIIREADIEKALADRLRKDNPDMTIYDVVNAAAIGRAISGNVAALQYVRDTRGDAPVKQIEVTENITTEADRALLQSIASRLEDGGRLEVVKDIESSDPGTGKT